MATLISRASGNFTDASSWALVDSTSLNASIASSQNVTTAYALSSTFTPGAITVDGIAVYVGVRIGSSGTMSIALHQGGILVTGTEVTINITDLPAISTYVTNGGVGWVFFKFASPVTLTAATAYTLGIKSSSNSLVAVRTLSTTNWSRALRTTTQAAPAASDSLIIVSERTAPTTSTTISITMNNVATTAFGTTYVGQGGSLIYGTASTTDYYLRLTGDLFVHPGGTLRMGSSGTPIPTSSSAVLEFNSSGLATYGLWLTSLSTFETRGATKKSWTFLSADAAVGATSLSVVDNSGWVVGDTIALAPTERTASQFETRAIATSGVNSLTVAALTYAHRGTGAFDGVSLAGEALNLTRNVRIRGMSATLTAFIQIWDTATVGCSYTEFAYMGHSSTTGKRGITINTTTGSANFQHCANHDFCTSGINYYAENTTATNITINNCSIYSQAGIAHNGLSAIITNNCLIPTIAMNGLGLTSYNGTITGNRISSASIGIRLDTTIVTLTSSVIENNYLHSNGNNVYVASEPGFNLTFGPFYTWFGSSNNLVFAGNVFSNMIFEDWVMFGNGGSNLSLNTNVILYGDMIFKNLSSNSHPTHTTPTGFMIYSNTAVDIRRLVFVDSSFSEIEAHTQDINYNVSGLRPTKIEAYNTVFAGSTEVSFQGAMGDEGYMISHNHDGVIGQTKIWRKHGNISNDTTTTPTSTRLTPISNNNKLKGGSFKVPVAAGQSASVAIKVRESVVGDGEDYTGNRPRLMLKTNYLAGIQADQVINTATVASEGAWETLSGSSPTVSDDCVLEFYVDCDGTTGWINIDDFENTGEPSNIQVWSDGQPFGFADSGSSVVGITNIAY